MELSSSSVLADVVLGLSGDMEQGCAGTYKSSVEKKVAAGLTGLYLTRSRWAAFRGDWIKEQGAQQQYVASICVL